MSIKEKCGVLAFIPNRRHLSDYDYLTKDCNRNELELLSLLENYYISKLDIDEIMLTFAFANSLKKLNHRGYDGYGYSILCDGKLKTKVYNGKVSIEKLCKSILDSLRDNSIITYLVGHVRYSTNDSFNLLDNQPFQSELNLRSIAICFNGNIEAKEYTSYNNECRHMLNQAVEFDDNHHNLCINIKNNVEGAFSTILYDEKTLYAFRDNEGVRPLVYMQSKNLHIISSEDSVVSAKEFNMKFVKSNDIYKFELNRSKSNKEFSCKKSISNYNLITYEKLCSFESIYFSNQSSSVASGKLIKLRKELGRILGENEDLIIDENYVIGYIPNSAQAYGIGYIEALNKEISPIIKKSKIYERSFIKNSNQIVEALNHKFIIDGKSVIGKKVILIDDSIVRGNTVRFISEKLRKYGAKEVHIRVASPMMKSECNLGVNTKNKDLICKDKSERKLCEELNVDSIVFLDVKELCSVIGQESCIKCFAK